MQVIYVAPLKALVRERINDWGKGLCKILNKRMVELTGDFTPDMQVCAVLLIWLMYGAAYGKATCLLTRWILAC